MGNRVHKGPEKSEFCGYSPWFIAQEFYILIDSMNQLNFEYISDEE